MVWTPKIKLPKIPPSLARKGVIPAAFIAALSGPLAYTELSRWEGNILRVYADRLANGIPTYCAGRTDWSAPVGTRLTDDQCREVNKATLLEYGYAVLACTNWKYLTPNRLIYLTLFAVNVGKAGA
ncbi:glycoside hydrolase family protein, partial [Ottowia sp.]|uniref:glycoside hydrolase family protein n=1 Tax=Ottowia sp. TaxID=1898956 RepID=UPI003A8A6E6E